MQTTEINKTYSDFRFLLQEELSRRIHKNPSYSLRAFSKSLQINVASLSRLIRGERELTPKMMSRLGERLGLSSFEVQNCLVGKSEKVIGREKRSVAKFKQISVDHFKAVAEWYHLAILELIRVSGFTNSPRWVAKKLNISVNNVNIALERLQRIGLIGIDSNGTWELLSPSNSFVPKPSDMIPAHRRLQKQILEMAGKALDEIPLEHRDQSAMTMAIASHRLPEAIEKLTRFRREFCEEFQNDENLDSVYQLSLSFFPLTNFEPKRSNK